MVTDQLLSALSFAHFVRVFSDSGRYESVTDTDEAFLDKIHLVNLLILVVNYWVEDVLESPGEKTLGDLVEQADVLLLVHSALGVVEEATEGRYHVLEQVAYCDFDLDLIWHIVKIGVILIEKLIAVVRLIEIEITFYALLEGLSER